MKILKYFPLLCCCIAMIACEDEVSTLGSSLNASDITITVDSTFTKVTGQSVFTDSIIGRTTDPLLGNLTMKGYGTLQTGFLTQFMPTLNLDTAGVSINTLDSIKLFLNYYNTDLTGDSLAPMVINIYRLNKTVTAPLYTNINPSDYYTPENLLASHAFGSSLEGFLDGNSDDPKPYKRIAIKLPIELGQEIFTEYKQNPDIFASPAKFAQFFPGVYMNIVYGNGRVVNIKGVFMTMFYHSVDLDGKAEQRQYTYMGVTPEIYSINHFTLTPDATLKQNVESGKIYVQAPIGYMPIIKFPTRNIIERYREALGTSNKIQNILNSLTFTIPAIANENNGLTPPTYLLFIRQSQAAEFFLQKKLPDNVNSFYATYDATNKLYNFGDVSKYIRNIIDSGNEVTNDDELIAIIPIQLITETSSNYYTTTTEITSVTPYASSPTIIQLDLENAKLKINYTTQTSF